MRPLCVPPTAVPTYDTSQKLLKCQSESAPYSTLVVPLDESEVLNPAEAAHDVDGALLDLEHFWDVEMLQRERFRVGLLYHINAHLQRLFEKGKEM